MIRTTIVTLAFGLSLPVAALAQERMPADQGFERHLFPPELVMQHQRQIGLTDQQRAVLTEAITKLQADVVQLQWQLHDANARLAELLQSSRVDAAAALQQVDRMLEIERTVKKSHLALLIRIKNTLSIEQQATLEELTAAQRMQGPVR